MSTFNLELNKRDIKENEYNKQEREKYFYLTRKLLRECLRKMYVSYNTIIINLLLSNEKCHLVSVFKDNLFSNDYNEFLYRFYNERESKIRIKKIVNFYNVTSVLYPNYTPLPESKYIYKSIMRKQKVINAREELEDLIYIKKKNNNKNLNTNAHLKEKVFDSQLYDEIMNQSNSILMRFFGLNQNQSNKSDNEEKNFKFEQEKSEDKIKELIQEIEKKENNKQIKKKQNNINSKITTFNNNVKLILKEGINMRKSEKKENKTIVSPLKDKNSSIMSIVRKKSSMYSRNVMNSTYYSSLNSQLNSYSTISRQNKQVVHRPMPSMPKISNENRISCKIKFSPEGRKIGNLGLIKMKNNICSPNKKKKKVDLVINKKSIDFSNALKYFGIYIFRSSPGTERTYKKKKILHTQKFDLLEHKFKKNLKVKHNNILTDGVIS